MSRDAAHLTFNGEIYNYAELRNDLEAIGCRFRTRSDTEVLLATMIKWSVMGLDRLKGMFAFAYYDERDRAVYLVRDRFGKKPLVYMQHESGFYAASEAKQILAALQCRPTMNERMALRYLEFGHLNGTAETFFAGISEVPAGHYLRFDVDSGRTELVRWYDVSERIRSTDDTYGEAREKVRGLLAASVQRRHVADVDVGACLSGGIDSSSIVALSSILFRQKLLTTITSYSTDPGYDERHFSRSVAKTFGIEPIEINPPVSKLWQPEFQSELALYHEQPISGGSQLNEYFVFKKAHEYGLKVMLDGQGADEYFGGYGEFWLSAQLELLRNRHFGAFIAGLKARADAQKRSFHATLLNFVSAASARAPERNPESGWLKFRAGVEAPRRAGQQSFRKLSLEELSRSSVPFQLHSEDRSSMRWSVEARLPFLDHDLVEYVLSLPTEYKCRRGVQKAILRDAVRELPAEVAQRRDKIGFASPDAGSFFQNTAKIKDVLAAAVGRLERFVHADVIMSRFESIACRGSGYDSAIFRIMALDGWLRAFDPAF
jgi:asparagine synthase (glutamine-hydrolysing)